MSRFNHARQSQVGGTTLTTMIRHSGHRTQISNRLGKELGKARELLQVTMAQLNGPALGTAYKRFATRYFLAPDTGPSTSDLETIKNIILLTANGLASDVTIKVGDHAGKGDEDVHGQVNYKVKATAKPYHNQVLDLDDGITYRAGAVMMDDDTLLNGGRLAVVTLIHEATHKYAGTNDYCYFEDDSYNPDGVFTDKIEALKNADSYAWFVYKMGNTYRT